MLIRTAPGTRLSSRSGACPGRPPCALRSNIARSASRLGRESPAPVSRLAGKAELFTGIEGVSSRLVRRIVLMG